MTVVRDTNLLAPVSTAFEAAVPTAAPVAAPKKPRRVNFTNASTKESNLDCHQALYR